MTVASAMAELNDQTNTTTSITLFYYVKSYGARTEDADKLNDFIIEKSGAIQFYVNSKTNVSNNFYIIFSQIIFFSVLVKK